MTQLDRLADGVHGGARALPGSPVGAGSRGDQCGPLARPSRLAGSPRAGEPVPPASRQGFTGRSLIPVRLSGARSCALPEQLTREARTGGGQRVDGTEHVQVLSAELLAMASGRVTAVDGLTVEPERSSRRPAAATPAASLGGASRARPARTSPVRSHAAQTRTVRSSAVQGHGDRSGAARGCTDRSRAARSGVTPNRAARSGADQNHADRGWRLTDRGIAVVLVSFLAALILGLGGAVHLFLAVPNTPVSPESGAILAGSASGQSVPGQSDPGR